MSFWYKNDIWPNECPTLEGKIRARDSSGFQKPLSPVWVNLYFQNQKIQNKGF